MDRNVVALIIVIAYVAALFGFSFYAKAKRRKLESAGRGTEEFLLAGKSMGLITVTVTVIGAAVGANGTVGIAQNGYAFGISAGWYDGAFGIGIILTAFLFAKKLRELNINTISQIYGDYYGESARFTASSGQLLINFCITTAQYIGGGAILSNLLPEYFNMVTGMLVSFVIYLGICLIGGMGSTSVTNIVNIVLLYTAIILAVVFCLRSTGGWETMVRALPDPGKYTSMVDGLGLGVLVAYLVLYFCNASCTQASTQMLFSAKNAKVAFWGFLIGGLLVIPIGFGSAVIGMAGRVLFPAIENTAGVFPAVVMTFPGVMAGVVLSGMWAADVSTATTLIMSGSTLFMNDFYLPLRKGEPNPKREVAISKLALLLFSLGALFCAFFVKELLSFITTFSSIVAGYLVLLVATIYCPKLCKRSSANAVMAANFTVLGAWLLIPAIHVVPHVLYLQFAVAVLVFLAVYVVDRRPAFFRTEGFQNKFGYQPKL